ncbi:CHAP domain-containing protein [Actinomyces lilanjuaniae]|uniref:CHAP domain-containing protein n=1 Tax=Actinomyces lilanjuaniae TaxID=2321394 RepID=A0ABM6Z3Q8_9ACTO|nr:CHAP domain-containing protein [Actinomyces lilanjuaniae]AYD89659.1 CHAP domain-containing protein [Actinomyces lilanjuaniae]
MARASDALRVAAGEIGYTRWADPEAGTKYGRWYASLFGAYFGTTGVPYCAMFVSWVLEQVEMTPPGGHFAYCPYGIQAGQRAGRSVATGNGQPGDMIFFDWNADGVADHVGLIEKRIRGGYQTIEGNTSKGSVGSQSNGGGVYRRARGSSVCAIVRPAYDGTAATNAPKVDTQSGFDRRGALIVDRIWGASTTLALQTVLGLSARDGIISSQDQARKTDGTLISCKRDSWELVRSPKGSVTMAALQGVLRVDADGIAGPATARALRAYLRLPAGTRIDGDTTAALQTRLRAGRLGG